MNLETHMKQQSHNHPSCAGTWAKKTAIRVALGLMIAVGIYYSYQPKPDLPTVLLEVAPWSLVDHNGQDFGSKQLEGKVWVANFFFTRCPTICPELMRKMAHLQQELLKQANTISFVSFSVDPEYDTPRILQKYRLQKQLKGLSDANWIFVTGEKKQLYELVVNQMKLHVGKKQPLQGGSKRFDIGHVAHFILFDQQGRVRGLFDTSQEGLQDLKRKAYALMHANNNS